jgi:16S rRNA (adenine1518-N6/adenine1519-N6)-dimethyltransferase
MSFKNNDDNLDQHFLVDNDILTTFVKEASLNSTDIVLEIGAGKGNISRLVAPLVKHLYCIEIDKRLEPYLTNIKKDYANVTITYNNILNMELPVCTKIITDLPFSIIEPLMFKLINCHFDELLMIIGNRYTTSAMNKEMTKLSLFTNSYFKIDDIMEIPPTAFNPQPRVLSSIVRLTPLEASKLKDNTYLIFRYLFYFKDKKVKNALIESLIRASEIRGNKLTQRMSKELISKINIPVDILAKTFETCTNSELAILFTEVSQINL